MGKLEFFVIVALEWWIKGFFLHFFFSKLLLQKRIAFARLNLKIRNFFFFLLLLFLENLELYKIDFPMKWRCYICSKFEIYEDPYMEARKPAHYLSNRFNWKVFLLSLKDCTWTELCSKTTPMLVVAFQQLLVFFFV